MASGSIKKVVADRGFGFITGEDGKDYFFHRDGLSESIDFDRLVGGEQVTFDVESNPRGPRAANISRAGGCSLVEWLPARSLCTGQRCEQSDPLDDPLMDPDMTMPMPGGTDPGGGGDEPAGS
jgi:cold shock protein